MNRKKDNGGSEQNKKSGAGGNMFDNIVRKLVASSILPLQEDLRRLDAFQRDVSERLNNVYERMGSDDKTTGAVSAKLDQLDAFQRDVSERLNNVYERMGSDDKTTGAISAKLDQLDALQRDSSERLNQVYERMGSDDKTTGAISAKLDQLDALQHDSSERLNNVYERMGSDDKTTGAISAKLDQLDALQRDSSERLNQVYERMGSDDKTTGAISAKLDQLDGLQRDSSERLNQVYERMGSDDKTTQSILERMIADGEVTAKSAFAITRQAEEFNRLARIVEPHSRQSVLEKNAGYASAYGMIDMESIARRVRMVEPQESQIALQEAAETFKRAVSERMNASGSGKALFVLFDHYWTADRGMEALRNEASNFVKQLKQNSQYDVKLVSIEDETRPYDALSEHISVREDELHAVYGAIKPVLTLFFTSVLHIGYAGGLLFTQKMMIFVRGRNPLHGVTEEGLAEILHANDMGMHAYSVPVLQIAREMRAVGFHSISVDMPAIPVDEEALESTRRGASEEKFVVGFASSPMEEAQTAARGALMIGEVAARCPDVKFLILWRHEGISYPDQYEGLANLEMRYGRQDMRGFYREVDAVMIPYTSIDHNHACPLSAMEAMMRGIPVVASSLSGVSELVEYYGLGVVCAPEVMDMHSAVYALRERYAGYAEKSRSILFRRDLCAKNMVDRIERWAERYAPEHPVTLNYWRLCLANDKKKLVKGHDAIKAYYAAQEVAGNYSEERFLSYPENLVDALERASIQAIIESAGKGRAARILDIASGNGRILQALTEYGDITAADSSEAMLRIVQQKYSDKTSLQTVYLDFSLDALEGQFDVITTFRYIRHFECRERKALYEKIQTNMKPDGILIFDVPNMRAETNIRIRSGWNHYNVYDVFFTMEGFCEEMREAGFEILSMTPIGAGLYSDFTGDQETPLTWTACLKKI